MNLKKTITSASLQDTQNLAKDLKNEILNKKIVHLYGALGTGKTALVKAIAKELNISENVTSPTYTYQNTYAFRSQNSELKTLHHFDLYRLPDESEHPARTAAEIGLEQALANPQALVLIEWPERLDITWPKHIKINCNKSDQNHIFSISSAEQ